ncbi:MAG: type 2 lanthipeptide synthetase LanM, partial [Gammaproteobacteria bacterium]
IPLFTTRPDSRDLWTSRGERIEGFFDQSGLAAVKQRLSRLSEESLSRQLWFIDASLATLGHDQGETSITARPRLEPSAPATSAQLIGTAKKVANRLAQLAVRDGDLAIWFGSRYKHDRWAVELVGLDLYDGLAGIALFLAHLDAVSGEHRYTTLAKCAFATVETYLRDDDYQPPGIGGFTGWGSLLYTLSQLAFLWRRPDLIDLGESIVARLAEPIRADDQHDIIAGAAGCIASLLSLYAVRRSEATLIAARCCGDHLLDAAHQVGSTASWTAKNVAELPVAGFSHGAAGIAHALLALFRASGDRRYRATAQAAIEFERTLYSPTDKNWLDRRDGHGHRQTDAGSCMTAWCHGAPGIGLARLRALGYGDDRAVRGEIAAALASTLNHGFGHNHSLCHGDLGNLEFLFEASRVLQDPALKFQVGQIAASVLDSIRRDGYLCGIPSRQETPGLMNGLAGIGYGLLRLAVPDRVPSVLTLDPPLAMAARVARESDRHAA